jgi:hypothetical protein
MYIEDYQVQFSFFGFNGVFKTTRFEELLIKEESPNIWTAIFGGRECFAFNATYVAKKEDSHWIVIFYQMLEIGSASDIVLSALSNLIKYFREKKAKVFIRPEIEDLLKEFLGR